MSKDSCEGEHFFHLTAQRYATFASRVWCSILPLRYAASISDLSVDQKKAPLRCPSSQLGPTSISSWPILVRIRTWVKQTHRDQFCPLVRFVRSDRNKDALQTPLPCFAFLVRMDLMIFQSVCLVFLSLHCGSFKPEKCYECVLLARAN